MGLKHSLIVRPPAKSGLGRRGTPRESSSNTGDLSERSFVNLPEGATLVVMSRDCRTYLINSGPARGA